MRGEAGARSKTGRSGNYPPISAAYWLPPSNPTPYHVPGSMFHRSHLTIGSNEHVTDDFECSFPHYISSHNWELWVQNAPWISLDKRTWATNTNEGYYTVFDVTFLFALSFPASSAIFRKVKNVWTRCCVICVKHINKQYDVEMVQLPSHWQRFSVIYWR